MTNLNFNLNTMTAVAEQKGPPIGIRHLQALLLFLAIVANYIARLNVSVAVVAMTDAATTNLDFPEYDWTGAQKSYVLSSFYWGYIITQFPAGFLVRRFGAKSVLFIPTFATAILSALTPFCISWGGWKAFSVIRVVAGLFQGLIFPCIHEHLAKWSPPEDRNRLGVFAYSGADCGSVMAMAISGLIANSSMGWPGIFYVSAGICGVWCLLWLTLGSNHAPSSHLIGSRERDYIERSMRRQDGFHAQKIPIPWRAIWSSVPFYALLIVRSAQGWANSTMQLQTPSYMHGVLEMDIKSNALYSALPFLAMWCMSYVYLVFADVAMSRQWMSLTTLRKSINTVSYWGPAAALIGIGFLDKSQTSLAITLMTINAGLNAGSGIGSILTIIDMSPNHSGMLMAIVNGIGNIFPLLTPLLVGVIVTDMGSRSQWQIVFGLTAVVFFLGNLVYIIWGTTDQQAWDAEDYFKQCTRNGHQLEQNHTTDRDNDSKTT
ncbi:putative inorganic phosphate cotransporter [Drosophila guanche]|uniref:Putative inorganic phosphate cotransporter n=2 Tax=Drosophila guanche TaxID=7266 RepID=A0A3B0J3C9_DROGU|nr:putative inorganic phosphate cotransporter [Drosophila guanche]SPP75825.1 blast:Putative inorganic phosphate cotransporter [Drosophila guanche]